MSSKPAHFDCKALRSDLGWTQQDMADYLGIDRCNVSRIETRGGASGSSLVLLRMLRAASIAGMEAVGALFLQARAAE